MANVKHGRSKALASRRKEAGHKVAIREIFGLWYKSTMILIPLFSQTAAMRPPAPRWEGKAY